MDLECAEITRMVLNAGEEARGQMNGTLAPAFVGPVQWPVDCTVGPGLEGAIACESSVGYVNGSQGALIYRGYDVFDLCAYSNFEEVSYLLIHGALPNPKEFAEFKRRLVNYRYVPLTLRQLMSFPVEHMNTMSVLRLGTTLMRQEFSLADKEARRDTSTAIGTDEDSIAMETMPTGHPHAVYEFETEHTRRHLTPAEEIDGRAVGLRTCYHLLSGVATIAAATARLRRGHMPLDPDPELSFAANYLYLITGKRPTAVEERILDICLILHADHGMNASTFAAVVVASTLSDIYSSVGSGIAALNGPLHGGANEQVVRTLQQIGGPDNVKAWCENALATKQKIMGFGHRVYKTYDPRARVLGPIAKKFAERNAAVRPLFETAAALEREVMGLLSASKGIYPNVDFYSGLVYAALGIPIELFTSTFAVARVAGWTARVMEYLQNNRLFRPRAIYTGVLNQSYVPIEKR